MKQLIGIKIREGWIPRTWVVAGVTLWVFIASFFTHISAQTVSQVTAEQQGQNVVADRTELWGDGIRARVKASGKKSYEPEMVLVEGSGTGPGNGNLASDYKLDGRSMVRKPKISERAPDEGVVVVDIWVDKNGNVTRATANPGQSRATNAKLYKLAEEAASKAVFNSSTATEQKGTLKISFRLN